MTQRPDSERNGMIANELIQLCHEFIRRHPIPGLGVVQLTLVVATAEVGGKMVGMASDVEDTAKLRGLFTELIAAILMSDGYDVNDMARLAREDFDRWHERVSDVSGFTIPGDDAADGGKDLS